MDIRNMHTEVGRMNKGWRGRVREDERGREGL